MGHRLTPRQAEALAQLVVLRDAFGFWPSQDELAHALGSRHRSLARKLLQSLKAKGLVAHEAGVSRSYRPAFPFLIDADGAVTPLVELPLPVLPR